MISIDQAISVSERRAKKLWLVSVIWALIMMIIAIIFGISIYQFNETKSRLNQLQQTAGKLITDLQKTQEELSLLKKTGSVQSRQLFALSLQMRGPDKLTPEQKEFVKRAAEEGSRETPTPDGLAIQAYSALIDGDYQTSYDIYGEALSLKEDYEPAYAGRSEVDLVLEDFQKAYDDATRALALNKDAADRPALLVLRARALMNLNRTVEAEGDVAEAVHSNDPLTKANAINTRGLIDIKKQAWTQAESDFRAAAQLVPPDSATLSLDNIGIIYLAQSNWAKAYDWGVQISNRPDNLSWWIFMIKALAAEKMGKREESKAALQSYMTRARDPRRDIDDLCLLLPQDLAQLAKKWVLNTEK
jgi:tetratricopeptide (TPR) repeat protein